MNKFIFGSVIFLIVFFFQGIALATPQTWDVTIDEVVFKSGNIGSYDVDGEDLSLLASDYGTTYGSEDLEAFSRQFGYSR